MEEASIQTMTNTQQIEAASVPMYFCPSRRDAQLVKKKGGQVVDRVPNILMDYAAAVPVGVDSRGERYEFGETFISFWRRTVQWVPAGERYFGVIVRSNWDASKGGWRASTKPIAAKRIVDGLSKTMLISEKRLRPSQYYVGAPWDDRGWSDGWDFDTMRSTNVPIGPDTEDDDGEFMSGNSFGYQFGSAHQAGMNSGNADGSVHFLSYDIDRDLFDSLADRRDGVER